MSTVTLIRDLPMSISDGAGDLFAALVGESDALFEDAHLLSTAADKGVFEFYTRGQWFTATVSAPSEHPTETDSMVATIEVLDIITGTSDPLIEDISVYSETDSVIISARTNGPAFLIVVS